MSDLPQLLLTYGPLGLLCVMLIIPLPGVGAPALIPYWYLMKTNKELELKQRALEIEQEASRRAVEELAMANRLVGELRSIAAARTGGPPDAQAPQQGR